MKKLVINTCEGAFDLSLLAQIHYYYLKHPNEKYYLYALDLTQKYSHIMHRYMLCDINQDLNNYTNDLIISKTNVGPIILAPMTFETIILNSKYYSEEEKEEIKELFEQVDGEILRRVEHFDCEALHRDDPILIQVVEELGENANAFNSKLSIVEIEDNEDYIIHDYDGIEKIETIKNN